MQVAWIQPGNKITRAVGKSGRYYIIAPSAVPEVPNLCIQNWADLGSTVHKRFCQSSIVRDEEGDRLPIKGGSYSRAVEENIFRWLD